MQAIGGVVSTEGLRPTLHVEVSVTAYAKLDLGALQWSRPTLDCNAYVVRMFRDVQTRLAVQRRVLQAVRLALAAIVAARDPPHPNLHEKIADLLLSPPPPATSHAKVQPWATEAQLSEAESFAEHAAFAAAMALPEDPLAYVAEILRLHRVAQSTVVTVSMPDDVDLSNAAFAMKCVAQNLVQQRDFSAGAVKIAMLLLRKFDEAATRASLAVEQLVPSSAAASSTAPPPSFSGHLAAGAVVPDEAAGPYALDCYHARVRGVARGFQTPESYHEWFSQNERRMRLEASWEAIDFEDKQAADPDWMFSWGRIDGRTFMMEELRPAVVAAQAAMREAYSEAYDACCSTPRVAAALERISTLGGESGKVRQPGGRSLELIGLYRGALSAVGELWHFGTRVIEASGEAGVGMSWSIKKPLRIWYKLLTKYDGDVSCVTDVARISLVFSDADALEAGAIAALREVSSFKNRFRQPTSEGYRDLMGTWTAPNGHVCEVQLHLADMMRAKHSGSGHRMYKVIRRILANPIVPEDTYCRALVEGRPEGDGEVNAAGEPEGEGVMVYASGDVYSGQWRGGRQQGHGTYVRATCDKYVGQFVAGTCEGSGHEYRVTGEEFSGFYKDGRLEGEATAYFAGRDTRYVGMYKGGKRHGPGTLFAVSGDRYSGRYADDDMVGDWTYYSADGSIVEVVAVSGPAGGEGSSGTSRALQQLDDPTRRRIL